MCVRVVSLVGLSVLRRPGLSSASDCAHDSGRYVCRSFVSIVNMVFQCLVRFN